MIEISSTIHWCPLLVISVHNKWWICIVLLYTDHIIKNVHNKWWICSVLLYTDHIGPNSDIVHIITYAVSHNCIHMQTHTIATKHAPYHYVEFTGEQIFAGGIKIDRLQ